MKERFQEIFLFLSKYQSIYEVEYLKKYPKPYEKFILPWIEELNSLSFDQLAEFESYPHEDLVENDTLKAFLKKIRSLCTLDKLTIKETDLPAPFLRKLNVKKKHEVQLLKTYIDENSKAETLIDIGGGAGYLSCALVSDTSKKSICIDMDSKLQATGSKKIARWHPQIKEQISFIESFFEEDTQLDKTFDKSLTGVVGLHSCGPLSTSLIKFGVHNDLAEVISFGCCYHKIIDEYNISTQGENNNLEFSNNALHLAGRSSAVVSGDDLKKRFNIKSYRYALHYYLYDNFELDFYSVGNSSPIDFENDFAHYAKKYHRGNELDEVSREELNDFFHTEATQKLIKHNFLADIIRMQLGRVIEIYLLMDRGLYLEENGREVELVELFNRELSPRNIMIHASLKSLNME